MILGDGLYNFFKVLSRTLTVLFFQLQRKDATGALPIAHRSSPEPSRISYNDQRRTQLFLKDQIPTWFAVAGYVAIAAISTATLVRYRIYFPNSNGIIYRLSTSLPQPLHSVMLMAVASLTGP
ncbi:hypothetical protein BDE02_17G131700 [Populus trichocarpa]|jgi:hypothetical protein|nr:hypothetical protein BDE02_17G131700 [Populus trichocarpa]